MNNQYVVIEKYFNSGKVSAEISQRQEDIQKAIETQGRCIDFKSHDCYYTLCATLADAQKHAKDVRNA